MKRALAISLLLFFAGGVWALEPCPETISDSQWDNCMGTKKYSKGRKFRGSFKDGKRHGQGTFTWADGSKFVGVWQDGKRHGQGTYTDADGSKYIGSHKDGNRHGQGTYTWADGSNL